MAQSVVDTIMEKIGQAAQLYYRLVLVVGPAGAGKTDVLGDVGRRIAAPLVNVNLELSRRMLDLTERQQTIYLSHILSEIVGEVAANTDTVLLDNIEILFDVSLKQDPLRLLQRLSRNKTVVAAWNGSIVDEYLAYATPDHSEYRRYSMKDFLVVDFGVIG